MSKSPIQRIIFGNPGTGKSHSIDKKILPNELKIKVDGADVIKTVFHPEYTYGDFMGKLLPLSKTGKDERSYVEYKFYAGHMLKSISRAYKNLMIAHANDEPAQNVALVIDEINRGNSSAIFGTAFQLLDRDDDGFSSYQITLSELEFQAFINEVAAEAELLENTLCKHESDRYILFSDLDEAKREREKDKENNETHLVLPSHPNVPYNSEYGLNVIKETFKIDLQNRQIRLPPNLSIIGTMNTSDNSIYFMDSAFKRRWDWSFYDWDEGAQVPAAKYTESLTEGPWKTLVRALNAFLKSKHEVIRGIEDKQVGFYFIKSWRDEGQVTEDEIQSKLMFFVWDSVFQRDKRPLLELLNEARGEGQKLSRGQLVTFGDFCNYHNEFVNALLRR
jgi:5-methylcytosine-specific restriction enzyme B